MAKEKAVPVEVAAPIDEPEVVKPEVEGDAEATEPAPVPDGPDIKDPAVRKALREARKAKQNPAPDVPDAGELPVT